MSKKYYIIEFWDIDGKYKLKCDKSETRLADRKKYPLSIRIDKAEMITFYVANVDENFWKEIKHYI